MNQYKLNGLVASFILAGLTACGGTTSTQTIEELAVGAAIDATDQDSGIQEVTTVVVEPPAPLTEIPVEPDADVEVPVAQSTTETPFVPDQLILSGAAEVSCDADAATFSATMLELVNASRVEARMCGDNPRAAVPTLTWNDKLTAAAELHGNDMASNNFFAHVGSDGLGVDNRVDTVGYNWRAVGENIAAGQLDQAEVHQGWLDSEGHCFNIMNELFTEVGAACVSNANADFDNYWVVVFGDAKEE